MPGIILVIAAVLRFSNSDWDAGYQLHPDERAILFVAQDMRLPASLASAVNPDRSPLNPFRNADGSERSFPYGHLPLYVTVAAQKMLGRVCTGNDLCADIPPESFIGRFFNAGRLADFDHLTYVGRAVAALFDTFTVWVTYLLAIEIFDRRSSAILSSALLACAVLHLQNAHFGTVDAPLAFFSTLSIWLLARYAARHKPADSILAGVAIGLAIGCKSTGLLLVVPLAIAHLKMNRQTAALPGVPTPGLDSRHVFGLTLFALVGAFAVTNPFAILDVRSFLSDQAAQIEIATGAVEPPFMLQYAGTWLVWYSIDQLGRWGFGLPLALAGFGGLVWGTREAYLRRSRPMIVAVVWAVFGWVIMSSGAAKFPRYLLLVTPMLIAFAGGFLTISGRLTSAMKSAGSAALVIFALAYAAAFSNMYRSPHPWIEASKWIYANVPPGSMLIVETNDDALPLDLSPQDGNLVRDTIYHTVAVDPLEEPDNCAKIGRLTNMLGQADFIVIASNRNYGPILRLRDRYPQTYIYYRKLISGDLGYRLEHAWSRSPNLLGWRIVTSSPGIPAAPAQFDGERPTSTLDIGWADESFTVYDHPTALLFRNSLRLSSAEIRQAILADSSCADLEIQHSP